MANAVTESGTGLVRVTVLRGTRRADLAVPGTVSVADLLPELVASVGALDPYTVHGGYRLVQPGGVALRPDESLITQGVEDGDVLTVAVGAEDRAPRVYDDVVEAVADAVERQTRPWSPEASSRTALLTAVVVLAMSAATLFALRDRGVPVALGAGVAALLLVTAAAVIGRGQKVHAAALAVAWAAVPFGVVSGFAAAPDEAWSAAPLAAAGVVTLVVAGLAMAAVQERRSALVPALAVAGLAAAVGSVTEVGGIPVGKVAACVLALVVIAGSVVPWMSLSTTRLRVPQARSESELLADPEPLDVGSVERHVRLGREVLLALTVTVGAVLLLAAPVVVALGLAGTLLVVAGTLALLLRTRQYRDGLEVAIGVASAVAALAVAGVAAAVSHPDWRPVMAGLLLVTGAVLLAVAVTPRTPNVRLGRAGDLLEGVVLVGLLPLLVWTLGLFAGGS